MKAGKPKLGFVGVFWIDLGSNKVYAVKSPLSQGETYGSFIVHRSCHMDSWHKIMALNPDWKNCQYEDYPRGRCTLNLKDQLFHIYVCPLIKDNRKAQDNIIHVFQIPKGRYHFFYDDNHYVLPTF